MLAVVVVLAVVVFVGCCVCVGGCVSGCVTKLHEGPPTTTAKNNQLID